MEAVFTSELYTYGSKARYCFTVRVGEYQTTTGADTCLAGLICELMNGAVLKDSANFLYELDGRKADILRKLIALPPNLQRYLALCIGERRKSEEMKENQRKERKLNLDTLAGYFAQNSGWGTGQTLKGAVDSVFEIAEYFGKPIPKEARYRLFVKLLNH